MKLLWLNVGGNSKNPTAMELKNRGIYIRRRALGYIPSPIQRRPHLLVSGVAQ